MQQYMLSLQQRAKRGQAHLSVRRWRDRAGARPDDGRRIVCVFLPRQRCSQCIRLNPPVKMNCEALSFE